MSETYAIACQKCRLSLWIGQWGGNSDFYVYTTEPETNALSKFLIEHRGEEHPLIFDSCQTLCYGFSAIDIQTGLVDCYKCFETHAPMALCPTEPEPQVVLDASPEEIR
jgi:ssDNA-binding Zn-finger/Zn-ribbon topoisomerase 1